MTKLNTKDFDTIIFDFGGVIIDINPELTLKAFKKLGGNKGLDDAELSDLLWQFERGEFSSHKMHSHICEHFNNNFSYNEFLSAWTAILLEYKKERIEKIKELGKTHKLLMLSNTNEIHFEFFSKKLLNEFDLRFTDLFDHVYLSHEMGLIKPNKAIYQQVIEEQGLNPTRTLFIEDTEANLKTAQELEIQTLLIPRNGSFYDFLK